MSEVASRELRNDTRGVLRRVEEGETLTITVNGRPVAELRPVSHRPQWMPAREFFGMLEGARADRGLLDELREMMPDTTDDLRW